MRKARFIILPMNKPIDNLIAFLQKLKEMDRVKLAGEFREIVYYTNKQLFSQIPGVSTLVGLLMGSWVASTFTNSPLRGFLASWGLMKGGTHVVSTATYRFISVFLPVIAAALTAYVVQKVLRSYREKRLEGNMAYVARLGQEVQSELQGKMGILSKAREAGLLSESEYQTKTANVYQAYSRNYHSPIVEMIIKKLEG